MGLVFLLALMIGSGAFVGRVSTVRAQGETPVTAALTPDTALVYIAVNLDVTSPQYLQATELLLRTGVVDSLDDLLSEMMTSGDDDAVDADDIDDLTPFLGGELGLIITDLGIADTTGLTDVVGDVPVNTDPVASDTGGFAAVVSAADPAAAWAKAQELLQRDATDAGATVTTETHGGVDILSIPGDELSGEAGTAIAQIGEFVALAETPAAIQQVIDTHAGTTGSIADVPGFGAVAAELSADRLVFGFVNGAAVAEATNAAAAGSGMDLSTLGVAGYDADTGFAISAAPEGLRFDTITIPGPSGALPAGANFDPELPARLPGNALFVANGIDFGATGLLDAVVLAALSSLSGSTGGETATPPPGTSAEDFANQQFEQLAALLGFNIKTDFIDQMVGEFAIAVWGVGLDDTGNLAADDLGFLLVSGAETPATLNDALSKLSLLIQAGLSGQGTITTRTIGSDLINVLNIPSTDGVTPPITLEYGVVNGQFMIGYGTAVDDYLAGVASPLSENPNYQAALAALPAEHNGIVFVDVESLVALIGAASTAMESSFEITDASEKCAAYSTQAAAQEAFDADPATNWELDQDFDGEACEDYFTTTTDEATPEPSTEITGLKAWMTVSYARDGMVGTSSILLIEE